MCVYVCVCVCVSQVIGYIHWVEWASQVVLVVKNPPANAGDVRDAGLTPRSDPLEVGLVFIWGLFWWLSW